MHGCDLVGRDTILVDDCLPREVAHGDDVVGMHHAIALNVEHGGVDIAAAAVEVGGMHMNNERLAGDLLGVDACRVGEPVVRVNDVAVHGACDDACHDGVVVDFLEEVFGVSSRELDASQVVGVHVVEVAVDVVAQVVVGLRIHHIADAAFDIVPVDIAPSHRSAVGANDFSEVLGFVAPGLRNDKGDVHVAILGHSLCETVTRRSESAKNVRRKLPSKH